MLALASSVHLLRGKRCYKVGMRARYAAYFIRVVWCSFQAGFQIESPVLGIA